MKVRFDTSRSTTCRPHLLNRFGATLIFIRHLAPPSTVSREQNSPFTWPTSETTRLISQAFKAREH